MLINPPPLPCDMELVVLNESGNKLVFEIKGEGHTVCNVIKKELWNNKHVKVATYAIEHPLIGVPRMIVETDGEMSPRKALSQAIDRLGKDLDKAKKEFSKEIREQRS